MRITSWGGWEWPPQKKQWNLYNMNVRAQSYNIIMYIDFYRMSTYTRCNCSTKLLEGEIVTIRLNRKTIAVWTIDERTLTFLAIYHLRSVLGFMPPLYSVWIHGKHDKGINKYILHAHTGTMAKHASCFAQLASMGFGNFGWPQGTGNFTRPPHRFQRTTHAMQAYQAFQLYPTMNRKIKAPITE